MRHLITALSSLISIHSFFYEYLFVALHFHLFYHPINDAVFFLFSPLFILPCNCFFLLTINDYSMPLSSPVLFSFDVQHQFFIGHFSYCFCGAHLFAICLSVHICLHSLFAYGSFCIFPSFQFGSLFCHLHWTPLAESISLLVICSSFSLPPVLSLILTWRYFVAVFYLFLYVWSFLLNNRAYLRFIIYYHNCPSHYPYSALLVKTPPIYF